jgi:hypothetical protein
MFKRLNTGGELLSEQEIRNCTIRMLGSDAINFLEECSKNEDFINATKRMRPDKLQKLYAQELVLRYFAIKNDLDNYNYPVSDYLTRYLEKMTNGDAAFDYTKEGRVFSDTFAFINRHFKDEAFAGISPNGNIRNEFVLYFFDGVAVPIATLMDQIDSFSDTDKIVERINAVKANDELQKYKTGSVDKVKARIKLFTEGVQEVLDGK